MAINVDYVIVLYNDRSLPDKTLLLTRAPIFLWFDDNTYSSVLLCLGALHGD